VSGRLCEATGGGPVIRLGFPSPFGCRRSLLGSSISRWGFGLPHGRPTGTSPRRTTTGFPRSTRTRCDRGGCLLYPGGGGAHPADKKSPADACRFSTASPSTPPPRPTGRGSRITRHQTEVRFRSPVRSAPARDPRMERESFGFPGLRTPPLPATHAEVGPGHRARAWNYATGIGRASDLRVRSRRATSCRTCFLVSTLITGCASSMEPEACR
jgi:hypothetical protein